ncbi:MAG: hypothetical protein Q9165_005794 [Trypethelium subeluteriae]
MALSGKTLASLPKTNRSSARIIGPTVVSTCVPAGQTCPNHGTVSNRQVSLTRIEKIHTTVVEQVNDIQMKFDQHKQEIDFRRRNRAQRPTDRESNKPQPEIPFEELDFLRLSPTGTLGSLCDVQSLEAQAFKRKTVQQPPLRDPADMKEQMMKGSAHGIDFQRFSPIAYAHCDISNFLPLRSYPLYGAGFGSPGWKKQQEMRMAVAVEKEANEKSKVAEKIEGEDEDEAFNGKGASNKDNDASTDEQRKERMRKRAQQLGMEDLGEWKTKK